MTIGRRPVSLAQAKAQYVNRFTCEHAPQWARTPCANGKYYAPQYESDAQWYESTMFPGEGHLGKREKHCMSMNQTWPRGQWLDAPYRK